MAADARIADGERFVLVCIAIRYVRNGGDNFRVRQATIAERFAVSANRVKRAMATARQLGYVALSEARQRGRSKHMADQYRLVVPSQMPDAEPEIEADMSPNSPEIGSSLAAIAGEIGTKSSRNRGQNDPEIGAKCNASTSGNDIPMVLIDGSKGWVQAEAPSPFCDRHPNGTDRPCVPCQRRREQRDAWDAAAADRRRQRRAAERDQIRHCPDCAETDGFIEFTDERGNDAVRRCTHPKLATVTP